LGLKNLQLIYLAFDLHISSDLNFSDMLLKSSEEAHVSIHKGTIGIQNFVKCNVYRKGIQAEICIKENNVYHHWDGILKCVIRNGSEIIYEHLRDSVQTLKLFLLSETIGILLAQRVLYLLHGSAVLINGFAHAFLGEPGAGKSTIAAAFWKAGRTVLTDDLIALNIQEDAVFLIPSFPQFKIWEHTLMD
jgi:hypothetical protein